MSIQQSILLIPGSSDNNTLPIYLNNLTQSKTDSSNSSSITFSESVSPETRTAQTSSATLSQMSNDSTKTPPISSSRVKKRDSHLAKPSLDKHREKLESFLGNSYLQGWGVYAFRYAFINMLSQNWDKRDKDGISFYFIGNSERYYFKFQEKEERESVNCGILRVTNDAIYAFDDLEFLNIDHAIVFLKPLFDKKNTSDLLFYERLNHLLLKKPKEQAKILSLSSDGLPSVNTMHLVPSIDEILHYEQTLPLMRSLVKSENLDALKEAFNRLTHLQSSTVLKIGNEEMLMPMGALVLYYLHIIQLNESPDALTENSFYAAKAFQNIEGCASSPDQRMRACVYARADILFHALEMALKDKKMEDARECIARLNELDIEMPHSDRWLLRNFDLDLTQGSEINLSSLEKTRQAMKQALNLP